MKISVPAGVFKAKCLHLLDEVRDHRREYLITKRGRPVARLVPVGQAAPEVFGRMRGTAEIVADIVAPVGERWEADE